MTKNEEWILDLPEDVQAAVEPLFKDLPIDIAMQRLVVDLPASAATVERVEKLFESPALAQRESLKAAIWLYVDDLDRSHKICQGIEDETGSFWHGIMHRREGDFSNSHHWFNQVGNHPVMARIGDYDPHEFVTAVETRHAREPEDLITLQRREWETLFAWCATEYGTG